MFRRQSTSALKVLEFVVDNQKLPCHLVKYANHQPKYPVKVISRLTVTGGYCGVEALWAASCFVFGETGYRSSSVRRRKIDGTVIAERDASGVPAEYPGKVICLPLNQLLRVLLNMFKGVHGRSQVYASGWGLHQLSSQTWEAQVEMKPWTIQYKADFVVECDGSQREIRKLLFREAEFPRKQRVKQIIAANVCHRLPVSHHFLPGW